MQHFTLAMLVQSRWEKRLFSTSETAVFRWLCKWRVSERQRVLFRSRWQHLWRVNKYIIPHTCTLNKQKQFMTWENGKQCWTAIEWMHWAEMERNDFNPMSGLGRTRKNDWNSRTGVTCLTFYLVRISGISMGKAQEGKWTHFYWPVRYIMWWGGC